MSGPEGCDCPGPPLPPPPIFDLPPPPRPPFLQAEPCSDEPLKDIETCEAFPVSNRRGDGAVGIVVDAEFHTSPALPSVAIIAVCSVLLVAMVCVASALVWKHKRKMQSFLPCKTSPAARCEANGNTVIYEDLTNVRPRALPPNLHAPHTHPHPLPHNHNAPPIEMLDVKGADGTYSLGNQPVFIMGAPRGEDHYAQDLYNPVYEELSNGSGRGDSEADSECGARGSAAASEDEFAEDELSLGEGERATTVSLQGSTGNDLCRDLDSSDADDRRGFLTAGRQQSLTQRTPRNHNSTTDTRRGRSLDRRRGRRHLQQQQQQLQALQQQLKQQQQQQQHTGRPPEGSDFHEGLLLDALLQMYPGHPGRPPRSASHTNVNRNAPTIPAVAHRLPYMLPPAAQHAYHHQPQHHPYESLGRPTHQHNHHLHHGHHKQVVNPYESVPVLGQLQQMSSFRPNKPANHDSDSGYSNNTSGGRGSGSGRSRASKDPRHSALSSLSGDIVLS